jgi:tRNA threonylcarbamoyladenosine biosynthesis protein TsaE
VGSLEITTASAEETRTLGVKLGSLLRSGDFVGLSGELGAGKTQLARGVAEGAGVDPAEVSSPTFSIVQSYAGKQVTLHHADFYRLRGEDELYATGFFDLEGAMLVEWIDQVPSALPEESLQLRLEVIDAQTRRIKATARGERHQALLESWRLSL